MNDFLRITRKAEQEIEQRRKEDREKDLWNIENLMGWQCQKTGFSYFWDFHLFFKNLISRSFSQFFLFSFSFWLVGHRFQCIHKIFISNNNLESSDLIPALCAPPQWISSWEAMADKVKWKKDLEHVYYRSLLKSVEHLNMKYLSMLMT